MEKQPHLAKMTYGLYTVGKYGLCNRQDNIYILLFLIIIVDYSLQQSCDGLGAIDFESWQVHGCFF